MREQHNKGAGGSWLLSVAGVDRKTSVQLPACLLCRWLFEGQSTISAKCRQSRVGAVGLCVAVHRLTRRCMALCLCCREDKRRAEQDSDDERPRKMAKPSGAAAGKRRR